MERRGDVRTGREHRKEEMMITTVGIAAGIVLGILLIIYIRSRQKRIQEEKFQTAKKLREDSLKKALANHLEPEPDIGAATPYRPYKVDYSTGENQENKEKRPLLQIVEKNRLSEKKYIFRASETVALGVQFGNAGVINSVENGEPWCEIFFQNGAYCVHSVGNARVSVQRYKSAAVVDILGIQLKSKDIIEIQDTKFQIFYVKG